MHTALPEQLAHVLPFAPQADAETPATHVPAAEQQPPLHARPAEHDVVHELVDVLHAYLAGQSEAFVQTLVHWPFLQVALAPQAWAAPQPPQLLLSVCSSTQAPLHSV
jgi:hypothetical protein